MAFTTMLAEPDSPVAVTRQQPGMGMVTPIGTETDGGGDPAVEVARRDSVTRSLGRLSRRERAVVVLRYFLDLSERQTAAELGISIGTVKSINSRALAKLRVAPELGDMSAIHQTRPQEG